MKIFWIGLALLVALALQSVVSTLLPVHARMLDPFLLVLVYIALGSGETAGMLVGAAAGWIQDVHFGGEVLGLSALGKLLVGFAVGIASTRFHLADPAARVLVLFAASLADSVLFMQLASVFELQTLGLSPLATVSRAALNAGIGLGVYELVERWGGRERRERL